MRWLRGHSIGLLHEVKECHLVELAGDEQLRIKGSVWGNNVKESAEFIDAIFGEQSVLEQGIA